MKYVYIVKIKILNNSWNYLKDQIILIPVLTNHSTNAVNKVLNRCCGSEYPPFDIIGISKADNFLFKPIL